MAKLPIYDPLSGEITSALISGIIESASKMSSILNLKTRNITDSLLSEVYIGEDDRYRIYQVKEGHRLWLVSPSPVIKINGVETSTTAGNYDIDYIGGSIKFQPDHRLSAESTVSVSATILDESSETLLEIAERITTVERIAEKYKGDYDTIESLQQAHPTAYDGDYAIVLGELNSFFVWNSDDGIWIEAKKEVDMSNYYTKAESDNLLGGKEPSIAAKGSAVTDDDFYYGGRKQWIDVFAKVRNAVLTGLSTLTKTAVAATDTVIQAIGKLQAQITDYKKTNDEAVQSLNNSKVSNTRKINGQNLSTDVYLDAVYNATVSVDWVSDNGIYKQNVAIDGINETDVATLYLVPSDTLETARNQIDAYSMIYKATTSDNLLTLYSTIILTVELPIQLVVSKIQ